jgi:LEA14-like dessication related protein
LSPISHKQIAQLLLALVICFQQACTSTIDKLEVLRIGNIRVDSIAREMITLRAKIEIKNPYYSSAQLKNISVDVSFTDHPIAYGKLSGATRLKPRGTAALDVPLAISCKDLSERDFQALFQDRVPFRIEGNAMLEKPFGPRTLSIHVLSSLQNQEEIRLSLNQKTALDILSPDASGAAELASLIRKKELAMRFYNPFGFPLSLDDFQYQLRLGNGIIAVGRAENRLQLAPGNNRFRVTVEPHPVALAGNLLDALVHRTIPDITVSSKFALLDEQRRLKVQLTYSPSH